MPKICKFIHCNIAIVGDNIINVHSIQMSINYLKCWLMYVLYVHYIYMFMYIFWFCKIFMHFEREIDPFKWRNIMFAFQTEK
jgi:hypothetical protein